MIVTIAPGKTLEWLEAEFGKTLENNPHNAQHPGYGKEGMTGMCPNKNVGEEELWRCVTFFSGFSKTEVISENLLDVVTAVSGSSPAYVFLFIEAMADAAVAEGMARAQAYKLPPRQSLEARRWFWRPKASGGIKDMVCSPGGTTSKPCGCWRKRACAARCSKR